MTTDLRRAAKVLAFDILHLDTGGASHFLGIYGWVKVSEEPQGAVGFGRA